MIHQHQNPAVALFNTENFQELPSCGIEDVDRAVFDLFDRVLPLQLETDGEVKKVPVIYATGERAVLLSKRRPLRDTQGALILPLVSVVRTGIEQDPDGYGLSATTKEIVIKKKVSKSNLEYKRSLNENNLSNQDHVLSGSVGPSRFTRRNFAWGSKNTSLRGSNKNIYEVYTMPAPRFFQCTYEVTFWVHFQQQINSIYEAIMSSYMTPARQFMISSDKGYTFTAILDKAFSPSNNLDDFTDSERLVKSSVTLKVNGYVINPEGPGLMPQIKRYTSSPYITFETIIGAIPSGKKGLVLKSGNPEDFERENYSHELDALPASQTFPSKTVTEKADILIGKFGKIDNQELIILEEDPLSGQKIEKKYFVKDRHHRKGETVLREVKTLG
jgi:hypothetical protein